VEYFAVRFEEQDKKNPARNSSACCLLHAGFLLGLLYNPENKGHILRNVG
jgi:hypothetical protein